MDTKQLGCVACARGQLQDKRDRHEVLRGGVGLERLGPALGCGLTELHSDAAGVDVTAGRGARRLFSLAPLALLTSTWAPAPPPGWPDA